MPPSRDREPLQVFITIDTEVWPLTPNWRKVGLAEDLERDIYGQVGSTSVGLQYQLDVLRTYALKAVFYVEPFYSNFAGLEPLQRCAAEIVSSHQDVQFHPHPEWFAILKDPLAKGRISQNLWEYTYAEQVELLNKGRLVLSPLTRTPLRSMRAGNFGANPDTLRAAAHLGFTSDFSLNQGALNAACRLHSQQPVFQPVLWNGIVEYPLSFFRDYPRHYRQAQICACSEREMITALNAAWESGWRAFVILSHTFEFILGRKDPRKHTSINAFGVNRFEALCRYLAKHTDRFSTEHSPLAPSSAEGAFTPLRGRLAHTAHRYFQQGWNRLLH